MMIPVSKAVLHGLIGIGVFAFCAVFSAVFNASADEPITYSGFGAKYELGYSAFLVNEDLGDMQNGSLDILKQARDIERILKKKNGKQPKTPSSVRSVASSSKSSLVPSSSPSTVPSAIPSSTPSSSPSSIPSSTPSSVPSVAPSSKPSLVPSSSPSTVLSAIPSSTPSSSPSSIPSSTPSSVPSVAPSSKPSSVTMQLQTTPDSLTQTSTHIPTQFSTTLHSPSQTPTQMLTQLTTQNHPSQTPVHIPTQLPTTQNSLTQTPAHISTQFPTLMEGDKDILIERTAEPNIHALPTKYSTNVTVSNTFNANTISLSACQKLDMSLAFMTSFDFQEHFEKIFYYNQSIHDSGETLEDESDFFNDVFILQIILAPVSLGLLLFGAKMFLQTFVVCAALLGLFTVFNGLEGILPVIQLDCPMKLSLSVIAAFLCAVTATTFFRFGVFCLGSVSFGVATYVIFDSFPGLDPGIVSFDADMKQQDLLPTSDLSVVAWIITFFFSLLGGVILRYFEMATLEILTAGMGGVGCAYSIHTYFFVKGISLDPALSFLFAFFISVAGWKFQNRRRHIGALQQQCPTTAEVVCADNAFSQMEHQKQLEHGMVSLLQAHKKEQQQLEQKEKDEESSFQILELTQAINKFTEALQVSKEQAEKEETRKDNEFTEDSGGR